MESTDLKSKQLKELDNRFNVSERSVRALAGNISATRVNMLYSVIVSLSEAGASNNEIIKVLICAVFPDSEKKMDSVSSAINQEKYEVTVLVEMAMKALELVRAG